MHATGKIRPRCLPRRARKGAEAGVVVKRVELMGNPLPLRTRVMGNLAEKGDSFKPSEKAQCPKHVFPQSAHKSRLVSGCYDALSSHLPLAGANLRVPVHLPRLLAGLNGRESQMLLATPARQGVVEKA